MHQLHHLPAATLLQTILSQELHNGRPSAQQACMLRPLWTRHDGLDHRQRHATRESSVDTWFEDSKIGRTGSGAACGHRGQGAACPAARSSHRPWKASRWCHAQSSGRRLPSTSAATPSLASRVHLQALSRSDQMPVPGVAKHTMVPTTAPGVHFVLTWGFLLYVHSITYVSHDCCLEKMPPCQPSALHGHSVTFL